MRIIGITGGTGFVGKHLTEVLVKKGYKVVIFTTRVAKKPAQSQVTYAHWNPEKGAFDINVLKDMHAVVHLGGAGVADKRWTDERKKLIVDSRVNGTRFLLSQLKQYAPDCKTLISASATGFYGPDRDGTIPFTETAPPAGDFLATTCKQWEEEAQKATAFLRTVILRFGIILGKESGAFHEFEKPMSFGIMPILGSGTQMVSWMEVGDLVNLIIYTLEHDNISGIYNAVAPAPVTHKQLMRTIASIKGGIKIPAPVPAFALKMALGELSQEVLKSCTVSAEKTIGTGFKFKHPDITGAVKTILEK